MKSLSVDVFADGRTISGIFVTDQDLVVTTEDRLNVCRIDARRTNNQPFSFTAVAYVKADDAFRLQFTGGMSGRVITAENVTWTFAALRRRRSTRTVAPLGIRSYPLREGDVVMMSLGSLLLRIRVVEN